MSEKQLIALIGEKRARDAMAKAGLAPGAATQSKAKRSEQSRRDQDRSLPSHPQNILFALVLKAAEKHQLAPQQEVQAVPFRRFRIDVAIPELKLAFELDGYSHHGLSKKGFHADRERDRVLTLEGWRIFRFTPKQLRDNQVEALEQIEEIIKRFK